MFRYGNVIRNAAPKLLPQFAKAIPAISALPKKAKLIAIFALTLGGSAYAYVKSHDDVEAQLAKDGYWDPAKKDITPKFSEKFATMTDEEKRLFLGAFYTHFIERLESDAPETNTHFKDGVFSFVVEDDAQKGKLWSILHAHEAEFAQELRKMGVSVDVVSRTSAATLPESAKTPPKTEASPA